MAGSRVEDGDPRAGASSERGSILAENVMTMGLLVAVFLVVVQFAYAAHVRSTLTLAASEGARAAARVGATDADGSARTKDFIAGSLGPSFARHVTVSRQSAGSVPLVEVSVRAPIPVLGPFGVGLETTTASRAVIEERP